MENSAPGGLCLSDVVSITSSIPKAAGGNTGGLFFGFLWAANSPHPRKHKDLPMRVPAVFALVVVIWSTTPLAAKWSIDSLSFITAAGSRMALGAVLCLMILRLRGVAVPWDAAALRSYAAAMVGVFGAMTSVYWAVQFIASGMISVIFGLAPIASGLLAAPILGERSFSVGRLLAMVVSLAGLAVVFSSELQLRPENIPGLLVALFGMSMFALSSVLVKRTTVGMDPMAHTAGSLLVSLPVFLLAWALFDGEVPAEVSLRSAMSVIYLGIIGSVVGFVAYLYVLQRLQAATVALIPLITPVFALLLGAWLADEIVPASTLQGAALVLLGLGCYQYGDRLLARWRLRPC